MALDIEKLKQIQPELFGNIDQLITNLERQIVLLKRLKKGFQQQLDKAGG